MSRSPHVDLCGGYVCTSKSTIKPKNSERKTAVSDAFLFQWTLYDFDFIFLTGLLLYMHNSSGKRSQLFSISRISNSVLHNQAARLSRNSCCKASYPLKWMGTLMKLRCKHGKICLGVKMEMPTVLLKNKKGHDKNEKRTTSPTVMVSRNL